MLVFSTQLCQFCPSPLLSGLILSPPSMCEYWISILYTRIQCVKGGGVWGSRPHTHINTCRKVPVHVNYFRRRHFALPSMSLIILRVTRSWKCRKNPGWWNKSAKLINVFSTNDRLPRGSSYIIASILFSSQFPSDHWVSSMPRFEPRQEFGLLGPLDEGTLKKPTPLCRFHWSFCLGWWSNLVGSASGQKQSVKFLQNMVNTAQFTPPPPPPLRHSLSV